MEGNSKLFQMYRQIDTKCTKVITFLDNQITRNLKNAGIETRLVENNGLWCCVLLPTVFVMYTFLYKVSPLYSFMTYISVGLLFYCILFIIFMSISCLILKEPIYGGCIATSLVSALLIYTFLGQDLIFSITFTLPSVYLCNLLLRISITKTPKTFTIGEAMLVTQGIVLFTVMIVVRLMCDIGTSNDDEFNFISAIVYTVLSTVALVVIALYNMNVEQKNLKNLLYVTALAGTLMLLLLHTVQGPTCIVKLLHYLTMNKIRVQITCFWLSLLLLAVFVLLVRTKMMVKASTVARKAFHVFASLVFLSGILADVNLMKLAAGIGLGMIILAEALRKSNIAPISSVLQSAFLVYSDEKDSGYFAMTPIYLYVGLACPLIIVPEHKGYELELLSGVLAVGVGDTAASWFGSRYGINKWTGVDRTVEGTAFNILAQVATVYLLQIFELLHVNNALIRTAFAATVTATVEAKTNQVDNLILPFITIMAFQATAFLC